MIQPKLVARCALVVMLATSRLAYAENAAAAYLSQLEQDVVRELNLARTDPKRYADILSKMRPYFHGHYLERPGEATLVTQEGVAAVDEAIRFLRSTDPLSAVRSSRGLSQAAKTHVKDQQSGALGHTGSDGSQPWDRMARYGAWQGGVAENISYGGNSARGVVIQLIVDDGVPRRGHRFTIFNAAYRFVGVGCGIHARLRDMCAMEFSAGYIENNRHWE
jgi:uncharacterized protein YkwD